MAALGVVRAHAETGRAPARPLVLVDWADEEGRFGRSLFGSSAFAGTLDPASLRDLRDGDGRSAAAVLAEHGVELEHASRSAGRRLGLASYLELHIEQGPRMQAGGLRVAAVSGCAGVERSRFAFRGQAAHAGTTPIDSRRDAGLAAAEAALAIERLAIDEGGVATTGELRLEPGFATAVPGRATLSADLRHAQAPGLARMLARTREACKEVATARGCELAETEVWRIEPIRFDPGLVATARAVCATVAGDDAELASGALHDAAEVARVLPAAMLFAPSRGGISHAPEEDTDEADLALAIEALGELAARVLVGNDRRE